MGDSFPPVGSLVLVTRGISQSEKDLIASNPTRVYLVDRYTKPHGYAVIRNATSGFNCGSWHVHPEALQTLEDVDAFAKHRAADPHCTCPDCIAFHFEGD